MGFNIKNNYGPNIEVNEGGKLTLVQGKDGLWHTADVEEVEYEEVKEASEFKEEENESFTPVTPEPSLNCFAPKKNLQELFLGDWFEGVCVDKKTYGKTWREKLVSDLMASEHGAYIARLWGQKDKRLTIKGQFVGTLVVAGVLKGSNLAIARTILGISHNTRDEDEKKEANTFAKYMGQGKGEPYADWVKDYVDKTVQKR